MNYLKRMYQTAIFFQIILFIFFIIENVNHLDLIEFDMVINGITQSISFNFYLVLTIVAAMFLVIILSSVNLFGFGLNDEGTKNVSKYISLIGTLTILTVSTNYYVLQFGVIGLMFDVILLVIYLFYILDMMNQSNSGTSEE